MSNNIVRLEDYIEDAHDPGNGAYEALCRIVGDYSDAVDHGQVSDIVDIMIAELWIKGFKIVPLNEGDRDAGGEVA